MRTATGLLPQSSPPSQLRTGTPALSAGVGVENRCGGIVKKNGLLINHLTKV